MTKSTKLLQMTSIAKRLKVSRQAAHALFKRYDVRTELIGRLRFVRPTDLELLLKLQRSNNWARGQRKNRSRARD